MITAKSTRRLLAGIVLAGAVAVSVPAAASAATLVTAKCPVFLPGLNDHGKYVGVAGSGWTPNSQVTFAWSNKGGSAGTVATDANGQFGSDKFVTGPAPGQLRRGKNIKSYSLTATDGSNTAVKATASLKVVRLGVSPPQNGSPYRRVTRRLFGFPRNKKIWSHYVFGGKVRKTVSFGRTKGPCGTASHKMRSQPAKPRVGHWDVYYSTHRKLTKKDIRTKNFVIRTSFTESLKAASASAAAAAERVAVGGQAA